ncbi:hypothetical protein AK812_SmicGene45550, partial [Symbiodinium microadriaticum]
ALAAEEGDLRPSLQKKLWAQVLNSASARAESLLLPLGDCFEKSELIARVEETVARNLPPK